MRRLFFVTGLLLVSGIAPVRAQRTDSGTVVVTVRESMGMLGGFIVRSAGRSATTDAAGVAKLMLPAGRRIVEVTRIGFVPRRVAVNVIADGTVTVTVDAAMDMAAKMEAVTVTAARTERLVEKTPTRVEVLDEMEVDENT